VRAKRLLMIHAAIAALLLALLLPGPTWARVWPRVPPPFNAELLPDGAADAEAEKSMAIGRYYVGRGDHVGAIFRFKVVVTDYPSSRQVDEALARLADAYLAIGIPSEAQTAAAVHAREFPNSRWSALAANENRRSLICQALKP
jgi:outer membrane protein assembly factor BamD